MMILKMKMKLYKKCQKCRETTKLWRDKNKERISEYNKLAVMKKNNNKEIEFIYAKKKDDENSSWVKYNSQSEAAIKLNLYKPNINKVIKGNLESTGRYIFKIIKEKNEKVIPNWNDIKKEKKYEEKVIGVPSQHRVLHENVNNIIGKKCCDCKEWRPLNDFNKSSTHWDNLRNDCKICLKIYRQAHREIIVKKHLEYEKKRKLIDPCFKLMKTLRSRMNNLLSKLKNGKKCGSTMELTGCTIDFLKDFLEAKFEDGMTWDNHGKWHIDHIIPCCKFNLTNVEEQKKCFHYTNLQPLWAIDNLKKGSKIIN